jgi:multidrug efflux pump subunit AcrA (membrane-fusion protein)
MTAQSKTPSRLRLAAAAVAATAAIALALAGGCKMEAAAPAAGPAEPAGPAVTNRIDVPEAVRRNLGITFAKVEKRAVASTLRVPGRFEQLPSARREYRTVLPARVELLVKQYDRVTAGQVIAKLDSPEWRRVQHEAVEAEGEIRTAEAGLAVAEATAAENDRAVALLRQRTQALAEANAPRAELTAELALAEGKAARLAAEVRAARTKVSEANEHYASRLRVVSSVVNLPVEQLTRQVAARGVATQPVAAADGTPAAPPADPEPLWRTINAIEVVAAEAGLVDALPVTNGGWAEAAGLVAVVSDPSQVRFRGTALQADLGRLRDGSAAAIVPPRSAASGPNDAAPATLVLATDANADTRTVDLVLVPKGPVPWARPGVSAFAEVSAGAADARTELAIPVAAVVQDELAKIYFRRDPANPDKVIRVEADLGATDGRWVVVQSGLRAGDEVVVGGVYELKLTGSGKTGGGGGHFHADGTWHANGTPEK